MLDFFQNDDKLLFAFLWIDRTCDLYIDCTSDRFLVVDDITSDRFLVVDDIKSSVSDHTQPKNYP